MIAGKIINYYHSKERVPQFAHLSFQFNDSEIGTIVGLSGVGKTTFLKVLVDEAEGKSDIEIQYSFDSRVLNPRDLKKLGLIGFLSTDPSLVPWKSLRENLLLPAQLNKRLQIPSLDEVNASVEEVGLDPEDLELKPHEASFGMRNRVIIARILLYKPKFLLLDELFSGLDEATSDFVGSLIRKFVVDHKTTCILVTHDARQATSISNHVFLLKTDGTLLLLEDGISEQRLREYLLADLKTSLHGKQRTNQTKG